MYSHFINKTNFRFRVWFYITNIYNDNVTFLKNKTDYENKIKVQRSNVLLIYRLVLSHLCCILETSICSRHFIYHYLSLAKHSDHLIICLKYFTSTSFLFYRSCSKYGISNENSFHQQNTQIILLFWKFKTVIF